MRYTLTSHLLVEDSGGSGPRQFEHSPIGLFDVKVPVTVASDSVPLLHGVIGVLQDRHFLLWLVHSAPGTLCFVLRLGVSHCDIVEDQKVEFSGMIQIEFALQFLFNCVRVFD